MVLKNWRMESWRMVSKWQALRFVSRLKDTLRTFQWSSSTLIGCNSLEQSSLEAVRVERLWQQFSVANTKRNNLCKMFLCKSHQWESIKVSCDSALNYRACRASNRANIFESIGKAPGKHKEVQGSCKKSKVAANEKKNRLKIRLNWTKRDLCIVTLH